MIRPEGLGLSTSEKIKIILARIFSQKPKLVLLDQVLDLLETEDRQRITKELFDENHGWTVVMVSNDPELTAKCDQVIELDAGQVIKISYNHPELLDS